MPRFKFKCDTCKHEFFAFKPINKSNMVEIKEGRWRTMEGKAYIPYIMTCESCKAPAVEQDYTEAPPVYFNWFEP